jgi:hypothetical protein
LPLLVVAEHYTGQGDTDGNISLVVLPSDGSDQTPPGPMAGQLDDGTPVYYSGGTMHLHQGANTKETVTLMLESPFGAIFLIYTATW